MSPCAAKTTTTIIKDVGDCVFAILVDRARDSSVKEQIAFVLRYVNNFGEVVKLFIGVVHISNTSAHSLKNAVDKFLIKHGLSISKVRGQGYDGGFKYARKA